MNDLPSPKPNRRKLLALRFAALVVAVSALGAAYWFTRPPELVWWRSPPIGGSGKYHFRALVPNGWVVNSSGYTGKEASIEWIGYYSLFPADHTPKFLRWLLPHNEDSAGLRFDVVQSRAEFVGIIDSSISTQDLRGRYRSAHRTDAIPDARLAANIYYYRSNLPAFNRTYRQICDSLMIE